MDVEQVIPSNQCSQALDKILDKITIEHAIKHYRQYFITNIQVQLPLADCLEQLVVSFTPQSIADQMDRLISLQLSSAVF